MKFNFNEVYQIESGASQKKIYRYKNSYKFNWNKSRDLLERSVAIPIFVNDSKKQLNFIAKLTNNFFNLLSKSNL